MPKGICKSNAQILQHLYRAWYIKAPKQEVLFTFSTLYWLSGVIILIVGSLYGGKRVITSKSFDAELFLDIVNRYQLTTCMLPPSALASLLHNKNCWANPDSEECLQKSTDIWSAISVEPEGETHRNKLSKGLFYFRLFVSMMCDCAVMR